MTKSERKVHSQIKTYFMKKTYFIDFISFGKGFDQNWLRKITPQIADELFECV